MKEVDPPPPLEACSDTPEELRRVMFALGREGPSRATLDRAASALGPWLDAPPGLKAPSAFEAARTTSRKIIWARAAVAALALGGAGYGIRAMWASPAPQPASTHEVAGQSASRPPAQEARDAPPAVEAAAPSAPMVAAPMVAAPPVAVPGVAASAEPPRIEHTPEGARPVIEPARARSLAPAVAPGSIARRSNAQSPVLDTQPTRQARRRPEPAQSLSEAPAVVTETAERELPQPVRAEPHAESTSERSNGSASKANTAVAEDDALAHSTAENARSSTSLVVRASAPPPTDEYTLLWQARTRLKRDPVGALAILEENAERFEHMQLAPEREVLAVEALRALGRKDEADRRLREFRARYPGSLHLRRLQQGQ